MEKLGGLSLIEKEVLRIAEDIIDKNKFISLQLLQNTAKTNLGYDKETISSAIFQLILKKVIFPGKKLTLLNVLVNEKRNNILNFINDHPGTHLREIRKCLELNPKVTGWHLSVLENFELIYSKKYLKYLCYFPNDFKKELEEPLLTLKNESAILILKTIYNHPELDLEQIKYLLDLPQQVIEYILKKLVHSKIIQIYEEDGAEYFNINEEIFYSIRKFVKIELE